MSAPTVVIRDDRNSIDYTAQDMIFVWIFFAILFCLIVGFCMMIPWDPPPKNQRVIRYVIEDKNIMKNLL
jgi:hypothetical protein